jgi:hypothetical protein
VGYEVTFYNPKHWNLINYMGNIYSIEELGTPDLKIAGLQIWIHGRPYPNSKEPYESDWLKLTAYCNEHSSSVWVTGVFLSSWSFAQFSHECKELQKTLKGTAKLGAIEPELYARFEAKDSLGHIEFVVNITPDHITQKHDQSYLSNIISDCKAILENYPTTFPVRMT